MASLSSLMLVIIVAFACFAITNAFLSRSASRVALYTSLNMVKVGEAPPDFELKNAKGKSFKLSSFKGKKPVVVFFYPADSTPGCTKEVIDWDHIWHILHHITVSVFSGLCIREKGPWLQSQRSWSIWRLKWHCRIEDEIHHRQQAQFYWAFDWRERCRSNIVGRTKSIIRRIPWPCHICRRQRWNPQVNLRWPR